MKLQNQVAIITGAATGIGRATALLWAREGARVVVSDINDSDGEATVRQIKKAGGEAVYVHTDVTDIARIKQLIKATVRKYKRLDIFFHNAGVSGPGVFEDTTEEGFNLTIDVNLKAAFFGAQYAAPELKKSGGGSILFTSSGLGIRPAPHAPCYSASKAGLIMLGRALACLLADDNIRVNVLCPGPTETPLWRTFLKTQKADADTVTRASVQNRLIKRLGTLEEMAAAALYLVSADASYITGLALPVEGGQHAR